MNFKTRIALPLVTGFLVLQAAAGNDQLARAEAAHTARAASSNTVLIPAGDLARRDLCTRGGTSPAPAEDAYTDIYRDAVERLLKKPSDARQKPSALVSAACYAWLLGDKVGEARYRNFAIDRYDRFLVMEIDHDFHVSRPFGILTWKLHQAGLLTGMRRELARRQAARRMAWFLDDRRMDERFVDCNIALADTLAVACLAHTFADEPGMRADEVRRAVVALGRRILKVGDLNENASNYASLGICFFLELAKLEGWLDDIRRSDHFRNMFARMRDLISPTGSIPEYGDGYFRYREPRLDFVALLEMAARLYDDRSFQTAARRLLLEAPEALGEDHLHRGYLLLELEPCSPRDDRPATLSTVQYRRIPGPPIRTVADKLILRTGAQPGEAMVMIDLYARGSHAHEDKRPSVGHYEVAGVPLFHILGRRGTRSGQCGNSFWLLDQAHAFPGYPKPGTWNTMRVPAEYCFAANEPGMHRAGESLLLRNFRTPGLAYLRFDNLRLEGAAGTLLLDGFESPKSWHGNVSRHPQAKLESSDDRTQGKSSQQVNWNIFGEQYCTRLFEEKKVRNTSFPRADYDCVKLDYKYEGQHPHCNLRALFDRWIDLGDRPLECEVLRAEVGQEGGDAWRSTEFSAYQGEGNSLRRRIVLTREGVLVIVDAFTAGPNVKGHAGGQLWQLYALGPRGDDWYASESDGVYTLSDGPTNERRMLVKFMKTDGLTTGVECVKPATMHAPKADGTRHRQFFTAYSKQLLPPGPTTVAAMVVLPLRMTDDAVQQAQGISLENRQPRGVRVTLAPPARPGGLIVDVSEDSVEIHRPGGAQAADPGADVNQEAEEPLGVSCDVNAT